MARGKIQLKCIDNQVQRQITFSKRRAGLFKKANELSIMCDAKIGIFIFSSKGKFYELATNGTMQGLIEKYLNSTRQAQPVSQDPETTTQLLDAREQINMLKQEIETLQKEIRYMFGEGAVETTLDELHALEKHLEIWISNIRSTEMEILNQEIQQLRKKVEENNSAPITTNFPYPLTTPNEVFQF